MRSKGVPTPFAALVTLTVDPTLVDTFVQLTVSHPDPPATTPLVERSAVTIPAAPEKKLSKLQLKMLAGQASKKASITSTAITPLASAAPPSRRNRPVVIAPVEVVDVSLSSPPILSLVAPPSPFARTLTPSPLVSQSLLSRISSSFSRSQALAVPRVFQELSPDDVVLKARERPSGATIVAPKRK